MIKKANQQGTLKEDSSETIRMEDLKLNLSKSFLNWLIGFTEGSENTFIVNRRYLRFELNCRINNQKVIYYIKNKLGFGSIRKLKFLDTIIIEYSVQDNIVDLLKLIHIFNGFLRSDSKEQCFLIFYNKLKVKLNKNNQEHMLPPFIKNINKITLANSWLAGYADSRFLFYARWHKSKRLKAGKKLYTVIFVWDLYENFLIKLKDDLNLKNKIEFKSKMNLPFFKLAIDDLNEKNIFNNTGCRGCGFL